MRTFEQYDEICKYFAEAKQRDNDANEIQKHLQLYNLSLGEYLVNRYALWLDFRTIDDSGNLRQGSRIHCLKKCCFLKDVNNSAYCSEIWPTN